jgi:transcriptional regulator with XRE-family HTH domain
MGVSAQPAPPHPAGGFAVVIRRARLVAGISQSEVASGVGVAPSTVSQWERGQTIPTVPLFGGLVGLLGPWPLLEALLPPGQADMRVRAKLSASSRQTSEGGLAGSIRAARQAAGLTQTQLGVRVGVRQSSVGQWEGGRTLPTLPMLHRLAAVLGPWPLLEALLPPLRAGAPGTQVAPPRSRPSREELARLVAQGRSDQQLASHYRQPIGTILQWRRADQLDRAVPPRPVGQPARLVRPSRKELAQLAIRQGRSDQELATRYGCSAATIKSWRARYGLVRERSRIDRARVLTLCRQGLPVDQIAEAVGCTTRTVDKIAQAAGIQAASAARPRAPRRTGVDRAQVLALWRQGVPVGEIAQAVGRKPATIYTITAAAGAYVITGQRPPLPSSRNRKRTSSQG